MYRLTLTTAPGHPVAATVTLDLAAGSCGLAGDLAKDRLAQSHPDIPFSVWRLACPIELIPDAPTDDSAEPLPPPEPVAELPEPPSE